MGHVSLFQFQAPLHGCSLVRVGRRQFCFTLTISWTMPSTWEVTVTNTGVGGCSSVGCYERAGVSNQEHCHAQPQSLPSPFLPGERLPSSSWLLTAGDTRLENRKLWYPALLYYSKPCASFPRRLLYSSVPRFTHPYTQRARNQFQDFKGKHPLVSCLLNVHVSEQLVQLMFHLRVCSWKQVLD